MRKSLSLLDGCAFATGVPSKDFCQAFGNTFSYLACNHETGVIAISNNDMHKKLVRKGKDKVSFDPDWYRSWIPQVYRCHLMQLCQSPRIGMGRRFWVESGWSTGWTLDRAKPQPWYDTSVGLYSIVHLYIENLYQNGPTMSCWDEVVWLDFFCSWRETDEDGVSGPKFWLYRCAVMPV